MRCTGWLFVLVALSLLFNAPIARAQDPHPDDSNKNDEHLALLDLFPEASATHRAIADGSFSDPSTWNVGSVPGTGARAFVPSERTVVYGAISSEVLDWLRIDGHLIFQTTADTLLTAETVVVMPDGHYEMGSAAAPIPPGVHADVVFVGDGPIDLAADPEQLGRGLVSHGVASIHGAAKTTHVKVVADPPSGATSLTLVSAPSGWEVGDQLVLTGTRWVRSLSPTWNGTQDEEITLTAIDGAHIEFTPALTFAHDTPAPELKASVANFSRNVSFRTQNGATLPANQRAHVMFMHSGAVDVRYALFHELGRTEKSQHLDPPSNIPGRYALHFHRTGVVGSGKFTLAQGNAVWGSPGWGYVQHDSFANLHDNVAYDVDGAAFVAETGNETGAWRRNIAIRSRGVLELAKELSRMANHDVAQNGAGFWFQGRLLTVENNISAGQRNGGFVYMHRGAGNIDSRTETLRFPDIARYGDSVTNSVPPIRAFRNNEAYASYVGLEVVKANPNQEHDVRSAIVGFTGWELHFGTDISYTRSYTFVDLYLNGGNDAWQAMFFGSNVDDMVLQRAHIEGFYRGIEMRKEHTAGIPDAWNFVFIDVDLDAPMPLLGADSSDLWISSGDLSTNVLEIDHGPTQDFVWDATPTNFSGIKTDCVGSIDAPGGHDHLDFREPNLQALLDQGYFDDANGTPFIVAYHSITSRCNSEPIPRRYAIVLQGKSLTTRLGSYPGVVQAGRADPELDAWLDTQDVPRPVPEPGFAPAFAAGVAALSLLATRRKQLRAKRR